MSTFSNRDKFWFGAVDVTTGASRMMWLDTPETGADVSHMGFSAESTLLNGGGYARTSWDSHKQYEFSWGNSASRQLASAIQSYANGSFGRGLLYFTDPMYYDTNILPARWADPSMAANYEAPGLGGGVMPSIIPTSATALGLPAMAAQYTLPANYNTSGNAVLRIAVPPRFRISFGWIGTRTNSQSGIHASQTGLTGLTTGYVAPLGASGNQVTSVVATAGDSGGFLILRLRSDSASNVSINGMVARLTPPGESLSQLGPWMAGEGHSGCRFVGKPTIVNYNGVDGGQVGLACTLKETGAWE